VSEKTSLRQGFTLGQAIAFDSVIGDLGPQGECLTALDTKPGATSDS
jgi:hypothetical protein